MDKEMIFFIVNLLLAAIVGGLSAVFTIGQYKSKVDRAEKDIEGVQKEVKEIRDKTIKCETMLDNQGPLTKKKSPISLTERGEKVLTESGGRKFVDDNITDLLSKVDGENVKTSYDVQEASKKVIATLEADDRMTAIKDYLFKEGLEFSDVTEVLGIYLRDKIITTKGWNVKDIDEQEKAKAAPTDGQ
ncbi:MAG: hypothetical protein IT405_03230 [Candidatus Yanofskybacteria bacterium]|nr:hypothetical protein [Candidatus Yanofskybacteria bacterium]